MVFAVLLLLPGGITPEGLFSVDLKGEIIQSLKRQRAQYEAGGHWEMSFDWHGGNAGIEHLTLWRKESLRCMQFKFTNRMELSCIGKDTSFRLEQSEGEWFLIEHQEASSLGSAESHWVMSVEFSLSPVSVFGLNPLDELISSPKFKVVHQVQTASRVKINFELEAGHQLNYLFKDRTASGCLTFSKWNNEYLFTNCDLNLVDSNETKNFLINLEYEENLPQKLDVKINQSDPYSYTVVFDRASFEIPADELFTPEFYGIEYERKSVGSRPELVQSGSWFPTILILFGACCGGFVLWSRARGNRT